MVGGRDRAHEFGEVTLIEVGPVAIRPNRILEALGEPPRLGIEAIHVGFRLRPELGFGDPASGHAEGVGLVRGGDDRDPKALQDSEDARVVGIDPLAAGFVAQSMRIADGVDPSSDSLPRLVQIDVGSLLFQQHRGPQSSKTRSYDCNSHPLPDSFRACLPILMMTSATNKMPRRPPSP